MPEHGHSGGRILELARRPVLASAGALPLFTPAIALAHHAEDETLAVAVLDHLADNALLAAVVALGLLVLGLVLRVRAARPRSGR